MCHTRTILGASHAGFTPSPRKAEPETQPYVYGSRKPVKMVWLVWAAGHSGGQCSLGLVSSGWKLGHWCHGSQPRQLSSLTTPPCLGGWLSFEGQQRSARCLEWDLLCLQELSTQLQLLAEVGQGTWQRTSAIRMLPLLILIVPLVFLFSGRRFTILSKNHIEFGAIPFVTYLNLFYFLCWGQTEAWTC